MAEPGVSPARVAGMRRALLVLAILLAPSSALACWDGTYAVVGDVELMDFDIGWSPERAREVATWLGRLDALLPDGAVLRLEFGHATLELPDGRTLEPAWSGRSFPELFRAVAAAVSAPAATAGAARSLATPVFTVQTGAFTTRDAAERFAASLADRGEHGFFETGGFPADNPTAHVIEAAGAYRVVVGAFVDRTAAQALATTLGGAAFVRTL